MCIRDRPKGTIHIVSDVHGEFKKLKHIVNNASGTLRPLVEQVLGSELDGAARLELLNLIYYPREAFAHIAERLSSDEERRSYVAKAIGLEFRILRKLAEGYSVK